MGTNTAELTHAAASAARAASFRRANRKLCLGINFQRRRPEVGLEDINIDLPEARL